MKKEIDIAIIILHYNNIEDTKECIESFKRKIDTVSFKIVVIDNKSPNKTGEVLKESFDSDPVVDVLLADKNLGFSFGLNFGINYVNEFYSPKFVILSNNDIQLIDNNLFAKLSNEFDKSNFSVLGPMIVTPNGKCDDNPIFDTYYSMKNAKYDLKYWRHRLLFTKLGLERLFLFNRNHNYFVKLHKKHNYVIRKDRSPGIFLKRRENVVIHGCFIVLSKTYFSNFSGLDPRTFMYAEEDVLFVHLLDKRLLSVYLPEIKIYHKGGSSVESSFRNPKKKRVFLYENYIKAIQAYIILIKELKIN